MTIDTRVFTKIVGEAEKRGAQQADLSAVTDEQLMAEVVKRLEAKAAKQSL